MKKYSIYMNHPALNAMREIWRAGDMRDLNAFYESERKYWEKEVEAWRIRNDEEWLMDYFTDHPRNILDQLDQLYVALTNRSLAEAERAKAAACDERGFYEDAASRYRSAALQTRGEPVISFASTIDAVHSLLKGIAAMPYNTHSVSTLYQAQDLFFDAVKDFKIPLDAYGGRGNDVIIFSGEEEMKSVIGSLRNQTGRAAIWAADNHPDYPQVRRGFWEAAESFSISVLARAGFSFSRPQYSAKPKNDGGPKKM